MSEATAAEGGFLTPVTRLWRVAGAWLIVCLCLLLWWAAHYRFWFEQAGEWQFGRFGTYLPALTLSALLALLLLVAVPVVLVARRRSRERIGASPATEDAERGMTLVRASIGRWRRLFGVLALVLASITGVVLVSTSWLPGDRDAAFTVTGDTEPAREGLARIGGRWRVGQVARFDESFVFARRTLHIAPVRFEGAAPRPIWLLIEVEPTEDGRFDPTVRGVLVRTGVPTEVRNLYAQAGMPIERDAFLLMRDSGQVRWRSYALAVQTGLLAAMAAIGWLLLRRQDRRLAEPVAPEYRDVPTR